MDDVLKQKIERLKKLPGDQAMSYAAACEVCEGEPEGVCSGLDVPELFFCLKHLLEHKESCEDVKEGRAIVIWWGGEL